MAEVRHRRRGSHPHREALRRARPASRAMDLGGFAIARGARAGRRRRPTRSTTSSWARSSWPARARSPPARPRCKGGHPDDGPGQHHQQGLPLGSQHDLPGRPDDPRRRRRDRRGRRHGVDDPGPLPAARRTGRLPHRRRHARRLDDVRRPHLRLRPRRHGPRRPSATTRRRDLPRAPGRLQRPPATRRRPPPSRTACSPRRSSRCRCPSARATRCSSTPTRACGPGTTAESLGALRPAFDKDGTITAGNASQISDGGAAVVVMSAAKAKELGHHPARRARQLRPGGRTRRLAAHPAGQRHPQGGAGKAGLDVGDVDLFEINEAFAAVGLASADELGHRRGQGQRQRRRHRPRPPRRHVRDPGRAHRAARAASPRRCHCRRGPLRRRRPGRRRDPARPGLRHRAAGAQSSRVGRGHDGHQLGRPCRHVRPTGDGEGVDAQGARGEAVPQPPGSAPSCPGARAAPATARAPWGCARPPWPIRRRRAGRGRRRAPPRGRRRRARLEAALRGLSHLGQHQFRRRRRAGRRRDQRDGRAAARPSTRAQPFRRDRQTGVQGGSVASAPRGEHAVEVGAARRRVGHGLGVAEQPQRARPLRRRRPSAQGECGVQAAHGPLDVVLGHDARRPDRRGRDHVDVDPARRPVSRTWWRRSRVRLHADPDERHPGHVGVGRHAAAPSSSAMVLQTSPPRPPGRRWATVNEMSVVPCARRVLHDHVHVDRLVGQRPEQPGGDAGPVRHPADGDLGLRGVVGHRGDDGFFHVCILLDHPGAGLPGEADCVRAAGHCGCGRTRRPAASGPARRSPPSRASPRTRSG